MTATAVFMMVITIILVWGGLVASIVALRLLPVPQGVIEGEEDASAHRESEDSEADKAPDNI